MSTTKPFKLIVGLGNPGEKYAKTRHNVGVWFLHLVAKHFSAELKADKKFHGEAGRIHTPQVDCRLLFPTTFMNLSGQAVQAVTHFYNIEPEEILVAHDDLDLPLGTIRLKRGGGHGGHNGLRDIIQKLGTKNFVRLRIGIDKPKGKEAVLAHVLSKPSVSDTLTINDKLAETMTFIDEILSNQLDKAMNQLH